MTDVRRWADLLAFRPDPDITPYALQPIAEGHGDLLRDPQLADSVVFVVFDEGSSDEGGGGHIVALGHLVLPGSSHDRATNHYGLLRTLEDAWRLPRLGDSAQAKPITGIWRSA